ncbi:MAG: hypothetical protein JNK09_16780 [Prolixibacteraceae bacterium]|nr:hypothetical protein [Prolixibacteraceae bacterium]
MAEATLDLQQLFKKWEYHKAVIYEYALEGNPHFVFTQDFGTQCLVDLYAAFLADVAELVVSKYDGTLKVEHWIGQKMAPFVEKEWGERGLPVNEADQTNL